jgi:RNA polymerase sigma-B factor
MRKLLGRRPSRYLELVSAAKRVMAGDRLDESFCLEPERGGLSMSVLAVRSAASPAQPTTSRIVSDERLAAFFERWQQEHDREARDALVARFLPLARSLARRYLGGSEPLDDLLQVASLGLIKAIDRFDPQRGNHFVAFATPTILGELRRHFRDTSWAMHVPRGAQERAMQVQEAVDLLMSTSGRAPTVREIALYLELDEERVLEAMQVVQAHSLPSLDAPAHHGGESDCEPRLETIGGEDEGYELVEDGSTVAQALALLSQRERLILRLRFSAEMTQSEIAKEVGLSQMQISRVLRHSLARLRELTEVPPE